VQLSKEVRGGTLVVRVAGELDLHTAEEFRRTVDAWWSEAGTRRLLLNLSRVTFLDSTGLGAVLGRLRRAQETRREMALVPPPGVARSLLDTAALGRILPVYRSERDALEGEGRGQA
jgi:stage II sporulation protein AA (anti-sigma F factor antagonist)